MGNSIHSPLGEVRLHLLGAQPPHLGAGEFAVPAGRKEGRALGAALAGVFAQKGRQLLPAGENFVEGPAARPLDLVDAAGPLAGVVGGPQVEFGLLEGLKGEVPALQPAPLLPLDADAAAATAADVLGVPLQAGPAPRSGVARLSSL